MGRLPLPDFRHNPVLPGWRERNRPEDFCYGPVISAKKMV
jgi:hypothetical protein